MGDRTAFQGAIYAMDPGKWGNIQAILEPERFDQKFRLGETFLDPERSCGCSDEVAAHLIEADPSIEFMIWEDPKYEWLGSVNIYFPDLGLFSQKCDSDGQAVVNSEQIRRTGVLEISEKASLEGWVWEIKQAEVKQAQRRLGMLFGTAHYERVEERGKLAAAVSSKPSQVAHLYPGVISVDEGISVDGSPQWAAFCNAVCGNYACSWVSNWEYPDYFVDAALKHNKEHPDDWTDPGQLAYEAAEAAGVEHLREWGVLADQGDTGTAPEVPDGSAPDALPHRPARGTFRNR